jgi:hypothetical protein
MKRFHALVAVAFMTISPAFAGVYGDDLTRCLVDKSTTDEKSSLVQWIFVAMSRHPSVSPMTKITADDVDKYNKVAADLLVHLLTETCVDPAKKAIKYEGATAIQSAFQVLGQVAAGELFANPEVGAVMGGLDKFLDTKKLEALSQ